MTRIKLARIVVKSVIASTTVLRSRTSLLASSVVCAAMQAIWVAIVLIGSVARVGVTTLLAAAHRLALAEKPMLTMRYASLPRSGWVMMMMEDTITNKYFQQFMAEIGGGAAPARIEAGPGPSNGEPKPWQRGPTGGAAPWRTRNQDRDQHDGGDRSAGGIGGPTGGPAPWARDRRERNSDNNGGGDSYYGSHQNNGGYGAGAAAAAPPGAAPWHQAPAAPPGAQPYGGYPGAGAYPGYSAMPAPPGLGGPPPPPADNLTALIQQFSGAPPPPPPPMDGAPPPPPGDQPPPPPPPGA